MEKGYAITRLFNYINFLTLLTLFILTKINAKL